MDRKGRSLQPHLEALQTRSFELQQFLLATHLAYFELGLFQCRRGRWIADVPVAFFLDVQAESV